MAGGPAALGTSTPHTHGKQLGTRHSIITGHRHTGLPRAAAAAASKPSRVRLPASAASISCEARGGAAAGEFREREKSMHSANTCSLTASFQSSCTGTHQVEGAVLGHSGAGALTTISGDTRRAMPEGRASTVRLCERPASSVGGKWFPAIQTPLDPAFSFCLFFYTSTRECRSICRRLELCPSKKKRETHLIISRHIRRRRTEP